MLTPLQFCLFSELFGGVGHPIPKSPDVAMPGLDISCLAPASDYLSGEASP